MGKIFYFSGIHGIGKTTIITEIKEKYIPSSIVIDLDQYQLYPKNYVDNQIYRITNFYNIMKNVHTDSIVIVDRGPFDSLMYSEALNRFKNKTGVTDDNLESIRNVFRSIPSIFYSNSYIVYLDLSVDRAIENINHRGRESSDIMFDPEFIETLHECFSSFYNQASKFLNIAQFNGNRHNSYSSIDIIKELKKRCWLQSYEAIEK